MDSTALAEFELKEQLDNVLAHSFFLNNFFLILNIIRCCLGDLGMLGGGGVSCPRKSTLQFCVNVLKVETFFVYSVNCRMSGE